MKGKTNIILEIPFRSYSGDLDCKDVDEKQLVDFLQEGVVMAQFNHPRVIKLLGVSIR